MDLKRELAMHQRELQKAQEMVLRIQGVIVFLRQKLAEEEAKVEADESTS